MTHNQLVINNKSNSNNIMPNSSFLDVVVGGNVDGCDAKLVSQDLSNLGAYYDENCLNIILESKNKINENLTYTFNIRQLNGNGNFTTMDFEFRNKIITYKSENEDIVINTSERYSDININNYNGDCNDFKFLESVNLNVSAKFIILSIPLSEFKESSAIMLSSNVIGSKFIDKIDWREMYFPEDFNN